MVVTWSHKVMPGGEILIQVILTDNRTCEDLSSLLWHLSPIPSFCYFSVSSRPISFTVLSAQNLSILISFLHPPSCPFVTLRSDYTPFSKTLIACSSLNARDQASIAKVRPSNFRQKLTDVPKSFSETSLAAFMIRLRRQLMASTGNNSVHR